MHNTTHYRTLTHFAVMFLALVVTGCPGGNKQKETSPKKKTEKEGTSSTNEADTDNKNNGKTPPGNGKTLDHYKKHDLNSQTQRSSLANLCHVFLILLIASCPHPSI